MSQTHAVKINWHWRGSIKKYSKYAKNVTIEFQVDTKLEIIILLIIITI